jgi:hypothetical protein
MSNLVEGNFSAVWLLLKVFDADLKPISGEFCLLSQFTLRNLLSFSLWIIYQNKRTNFLRFLSWHLSTAIVKLHQHLSLATNNWTIKIIEFDSLTSEFKAKQFSKKIALEWLASKFDSYCGAQLEYSTIIFSLISSLWNFPIFFF